MASLRSAVRLAPRAQFVRPTSTIRSLPMAQRSYSTAVRRPADDSKTPDQAEQGQEDLAGGMEAVSYTHLTLPTKRIV